MSIKRLPFAAVSAAAAVILAACASDDSSGPSGVVATVNGTDITTAEVDTQYEIMSQNAGTPPPDTTEEEHDQQQRTDGLNQLIFAQILLDSASEMGVEVTEEDINATRDELITQYGGEEELYTQLEEQQGMGREEVDRQIEVLTTQEAVVSELSEDVTDEEIQTAYDEGASARHILVEDEAAANDALDRIDSGEAFADVAADVSTDQQSAENGGELGFTPPGAFVPGFEDALFSAEDGEVIGPVETQVGFHIIERLPKPSLDEVEDQIRSQLEQTRGSEAQQEFNELISEWIQDAEVTIHDSDYGEWDSENGVVPPGGGSTEAPGPGSDSGDSGSGDEDSEGADDGSGQ